MEEASLVEEEALLWQEALQEVLLEEEEWEEAFLYVALVLDSGVARRAFSLAFYE